MTELRGIRNPLLCDPSLAAPPKQGVKVMTRVQEARGYQHAYFKLRELAAMKAHTMTNEGWDFVSRAMEYCGNRYNHILLGGTEFAPPAWRAKPREDA